MSAVTAVFGNLIRREPTADEIASMDYILDAAKSYTDGEMPWQEAANIGAMTVTDSRGNERESAAYGRYVTLVRTPKSDPRRASLERLINVLVANSGSVITDQGIYQPDDLFRRGVTIKTANQRPRMAS